MLRESELINQRRGRKHKDSKRKHGARNDDEGLESATSSYGMMGASSAVLNFAGQPKCLGKGCVLQPHQLDALKWLASLHENGVNGILADDMVSNQYYSIKYYSLNSI